MNYLKTIKEQLINVEKTRGMRGKVAIDGRALMLLIEDYERMESIERLEHNKVNSDRVRFAMHEAIEAVYRDQHESSDLAMTIIMDCLRPLIEEKHQKRIVNLRFK